MIFCVSYAVRPANTSKPIIEIANIRAGEPKKMLMIDAMIIPITPIIKNAPHPDMSFFVVYPHRDKPAKAIEVTKNV